MPKLSVIVPVYNTEKYLRECIDSILTQTFTDFELILVDDGSTDGSGAICDEYAGKDNRIRVIHQQNGGITMARKSGVRCACGIYFSFIDSDDWIDREMLEQMLVKCLETGADITICDVCLDYGVRTEYSPSLAHEGLYSKIDLREKIYPTMLMDVESRRGGISGSACNKLFRRDVLERSFWQVDDSIVYAEDALFSYTALLESSSVYVFRKPFYHYRQHSESAMHQFNGHMRYKNALRSYYSYKKILQNREFDLSTQLSAYISINSVEVIRKVLLFDKGTVLNERLKQARRFLKDEIVYTALCENEKNQQSRRNQLKVWLAQKRYVTVLYLLYTARAHTQRATK